jgi:hypothetical protein
MAADWPWDESLDALVAAPSHSITACVSAGRRAMPTTSKPLELSTLASPSLAGSELGLVQRRRDGRPA